LKSINPQKIIDVTLYAIDEIKDYEPLNMREIARRVGCAHTNLYNYFPDFESLLWSSIEALLKQMQDFVFNDNNGINQSIDLTLIFFFTRFTSFYLDHPGWFRLIWYKRMQTPRPKEHFEATVHLVDLMVETLVQATEGGMSREKGRYILHQVHCYLHGEISIFLAGKGLIMQEDEFRRYIVMEAVKMTKLYISLD
jgi:AcrR family transcriptional regulator